MKKRLMAHIEENKNRVAELRVQAKNSNDEGEVRKLGEEIRSLEASITADELVLRDVEGGSFDPLGTYGSGSSGGSAENRNGDIYDSPEYRDAFWRFVAKREAMPKKFHLRSGETVLVSDLTAVIPKSIIAEAVTKNENIGKIWARCRHTSIAGTAVVPVADIAPVATWCGEDASGSKKYGAKGEIVLKAFGIECKLSRSLLADANTYDAFKNAFADVASKAILKAGETGVFQGKAEDKQFTGIVNDTNIPKENIIELTIDELKDWATVQTKVIGAIPDEYDGFPFYMAKQTFYNTLATMTDDNGQPISRVNIGTSGKLEQAFAGYEVCDVREDCLPNITKASAGDVVMVYGDLDKYLINESVPMQIIHWTDHDKNTKNTKAYLGADGHIIDPYAFFLIKLKASETTEATA